MGEFIRSLIGSTHGEALDVACGAGANIFQLSQIVSGFHWAGVDIAGDILFPIGDPFFRGKSLEADFKAGDFYKIEDHFRGKKFDLICAIQTFSSLNPTTHFWINCSR